MTGEELFNEYCRREGLKMDWDSVSPHSVWVWESAAKYMETFGGEKPISNLRSIKAGDNL